MPDVTVLGAGGATVTITLTSAQNTAAAQAAVNTVNAFTKQGIVDMQTIGSPSVGGASVLPGTQNYLAGALLTGTVTGFSGASGDQYILFGAQGSGTNTMVGGKNFRTVVVAGDNTNFTYANQSNDGQVFFGKNTSSLVNFAGNATLTTDGGNYNVNSAAGTTTNVNLGASATVSVGDLSGKMGAVTVNAAGASTISLYGSSTVPVNVKLTSGNSFIAMSKSGSAIINPGSGNVTVSGDLTGNGSATLFGGTGAIFGNNVAGNYTGGSGTSNVTAGFRNLLFSSTVPGSATLTGGSASVVGTAAGAPVDLLVARGSGQVLTAGLGNATLYGLQALGSQGGNTFSIGSGFSTVFGYELGGDTFSFFGFGASQVTTRNPFAFGTAKANLFFDAGAGGGNYVISGFKSGFDIFQIAGATKTFNISFSAATVTGGISTTTLAISGGATYSFFDTTGGNTPLITKADVKNV